MREQLVGELLQHAANVRAVGSAVLVDHLAEHQDLARSEDVGRRPVKRAPVDSQPQIALTLSRKAADRRSVERQVVVALHQELLVVVQHVQPAFEVAEQHRNRLDAALVGQVLETLFLDDIGSNALPALLLGLQVQVLEFCVGKFQVIT